MLDMRPIRSVRGVRSVRGWVEAYAQDLVDGGILRWGRREGAEDGSECRLRGPDGGGGKRGTREGLPQGLPYRRGDELSEERAGHDCANLPKFRWGACRRIKGTIAPKSWSPQSACRGTGGLNLGWGTGGLVILAPQVLVTSATRAARRGVDILGTAYAVPTPATQTPTALVGIVPAVPTLLFFFNIVVG